ncbi:MAG: membrane protein FxsA [Deltaproteobacteria bacterium]|jgi:UPF0716 protein FxsA|nr:membrane protein FxsA [Deltaproteobacteria bacterium]HKJ28722.1 FxsA family protein [Desulfuromonadales bacterium]
MFIKLLIIFVFVPVMELYILIEAGRMIGIGATVGLIMLTGVAGAWLARSQGLEILRRIQQETANGQMPAQTLIDGALILVGGLLLLTPGFFTDALGFSFLVPITRELWRKGLSAWLEKQVRQGSVTIYRI